jgi:hypothetical protein
VATIILRKYQKTEQNKALNVGFLIAKTGVLRGEQKHALSNIAP